jgi:excisionase family DNA binding protein
MPSSSHASRSTRTSEATGSSQQLADLLALAGAERAERVLALLRELLLMPAPDQDEPALLTLDQVAVRVQVHPRTIRRAIESGELPALELPFRGGLRVKRVDLDDWVDRHAAGPPPPPVPLAARRSGRLELSDL